MHPPLDPDHYKTDLEAVRRRALEQRLRIRIPGSVGLHRRRPGAEFHATPEFFLQTGGATDFDCPSGRFRLNRGEVCVMPAGVPHAETPVDLRTRYEVMVAMQDGQGCTLLRGRVNGKGRIESQGVACFSESGYAFRFLDQAGRYLAIHHGLRKGFVEGLVAAFAAAVLTDVMQPRAGRAHGVPLLVAEAEKLVRVEISKPDMTVASIAARLGCSPDHLTRQFRAERGMTLNVWITKERIALACELLALPDHNIAQIGWTCGFTSASYFIRVFRAQTGVTPRAWRQRGAANA